MIHHQNGAFVPARLEFQSQLLLKRGNQDAREIQIAHLISFAAVDRDSRLHIRKRVDSKIVAPLESRSVDYRTTQRTRKFVD